MLTKPLEILNLKLNKTMLMHLNECFLIRYVLIFTIMLSGIGKIAAQNKRDSLLRKIEKADKSDLANLQNQLAGLFYDEGNIKSAIEMANKSLESAKKDENFNDEAAALKTIGLCEKFIGNYEKAFDLFKSAGEIYLTLNNKKEYADCLGKQALSFYYRSQMALSINYYEQAIKIMQEINDENAALYSNAGLAYEEVGLYDKSFEMYVKAMKIDEKLHDTLGIAADYCNIANIFDHQGNLAKAIEYYEKSHRIFVNSNDKEQIAILSANIGSSFLKQKKYNKAQEYFSESLKIRKEINNQEMIANIYNSLGELYTLKKDYGNAINFFNEAIKVSKSIGTVKSIALAQLNLGQLYKMQGNYTEALKKLEESSIIAGSERIYDLLPDIYLNISDVWAYQNNFKKALEYFKRYTAIKDTINNERKQKSLIEQETRYETAKKEQEITLLKKDNELIHEKNTKKNIIILVSLIVIVVLVLLAFTSYWLYIEKKLANEILNEEFRMINRKLTTQDSSPLSTNIEIQQKNKKLKFENSAGITELDLDSNNLFYIASLGNYLEIYWQNGDKVQKNIIRNTMKSLDQMLEKNNSLVRCHRSYIVNLKHVKAVTGKSQNYKVQFNNDIDEIPISRNFSKDILIKINSYPA